MHTGSVVVLLLLVATAVAIAARRLRVPYTVALVVAGLVLGEVHAVDAPHLTQELLFAIFLPGLVFEAAFHLDARALWRNRRAVTSLAVPGVALSTALTAAILTAVVGALGLSERAAGFGWAHALVFAALISATDPIAVVAIFKTLGAPKRLGVLMEGESLLNDGTAVVFFTLVLAVVMGGDVTAAGMAADFVLIVGAGALVGGAVGLAASQVIRLVDDAMLEITITTVAAYGAFTAAEQVHVSGVIATVVAGLLCGNYGARTGMSPSTRVAVEVFWEYVAFALNSLVFLLIGFEVRLGAMRASWLPILAAFAAVTLGRAIVVTLVAALLRRSHEHIPRAWVPVIAWGGLRGGLSMVLALSLPATFAYRELIVTMTFGVVALSILGQGLTMGPLLRRLRVVRPRGARAAYERARADLEAASSALEELSQMQSTRRISADAAAEVRADYEARVRRAEVAIEGLRMERLEVLGEEVHRTRRHLLLLERAHLTEAARSGLVGDEPFHALAADIDARLVELESAESEAPDDTPDARTRGVPRATSDAT